jgi:HSP20 family protein
MRKDDPAGFRRLQSEVDKMFLELLKGERLPRYGTSSLQPNADVYYDARVGAMVIKLELAGVDPAKITLEIDDGVLRVSGVRVDERHPDAIYQQMEIGYGRFERAVPLPKEVDSSQATASYAAGFLQILVPLKARSASKRIPINIMDECGPEADEGGRTP